MSIRSISVIRKKSENKEAHAKKKAIHKEIKKLFFSSYSPLKSTSVLMSEYHSYLYILFTKVIHKKPGKKY